jgi:glucosamine--fructose-6-phosphate aminotransferase (isomerizing)
MCGIIACVGSGRTVSTLLDGLDNLEYRGYDSAGVAVQNGAGVSVYKRAGSVSDIKDDISRAAPDGDVGIGHTRWSTHGPPTDANAHPHTDGAGDVAVVHNGVIDNYQTLRSELEDRGVEFTSDTDTEVVPHLFAEHLEDYADTETAFRRTIETIEGSYAIAAVVDGEDAVYAARNGTPLVVGVDDDRYFLASDVPAFLEYTQDVVFLEDGDVAVVRPDDIDTKNVSGDSVTRAVDRVDWDPQETGKGAYDHYMLKEINTQPTALKQTIEGRLDVEDASVDIENFDRGTFSEFDRVQFVACGTSYHAALYGSKLLDDVGVDSTAYRANEYDTNTGPACPDTLVVAVTQSGETADTLKAMRYAEADGATTLAVTNVVGSTAAREADHSMFIRAGPEIGVAATKTFSSQVVSLALLSRQFAMDFPDASPREDFDELAEALARLPSDVETVLDQSNARTIANRYVNDDAFFFIGRDLGFPVAKEGALKFKEITYQHAEGFTSGRLKHGPLALVTPSTPLFAIVTGRHNEKTLTNAKEAKSRGAPIVLVSDDPDAHSDLADVGLEVPSTHPLLEGLLANVQLQLLAYHAADQLDRSIDKPRNLAKSVTVE